MAISQNCKLYMERKGITDAVPLIEPCMKLNVAYAARNLKQNKYFNLYHIGEAESSPDKGSGSDYPHTPTCFERIID